MITRSTCTALVGIALAGLVASGPVQGGEPDFFNRFAGSFSGSGQVQRNAEEQWGQVQRGHARHVRAGSRTLMRHAIAATARLAPPRRPWPSSASRDEPHRHPRDSMKAIVYRRYGPPDVLALPYGGGGNTGAPFTHDYVELFNARDWLGVQELLAEQLLPPSPEHAQLARAIQCRRQFFSRRDDFGLYA